MNKLIIFGDESGTMPGYDDDNQYFVTATISYLNTVPEIDKQNGCFEKLGETIRNTGGLPVISYMKSDNEFNEQFERKMQEINDGARISKTFNRNNSKYYSGYDYNPGNWIWIQCMSNCIKDTVLKFIFSKNTINEIEINLDKKSFNPKHENLFKDHVKRIRKVWIELLRSKFGENSNINTRLMANESNIYIKWIDIEQTFHTVHALAKMCYRYFQSNKIDDFINEFGEIGHGNFIYNITDLISRPVDMKIKDKLNYNLTHLLKKQDEKKGGVSGHDLVLSRISLATLLKFIKEVVP